MLESEPDVMTVKEVMKTLKCGRTKVMQLIHENTLDAHFICGKWLVFKSDLEETILRY